MSAPTGTKHLFIDENTSGDHVVLAGVSGKTISVIAYQINAVGNVTLEIRSGSTLLCGPYFLISNDEKSSPGWARPGDFLFETADGEDLIINFGSAARATILMVVAQT